MMKHIKGFTLIELVITMLLVGILSTSIAVFISRPILAQSQVAIRAELVNSAEFALRRIRRDIQNAVPNSVRVKTSGTQNAIEFLNTVEGARYVTNSSTASQNLIFTGTSSQFSVVGTFQVAASNSTCLTNACRLVIYNTGAYSGSGFDSPIAGSNVYSLSTSAGPMPPPGSAVITPAGSTITISNSTQGDVTLSPSMLFAFPSPMQRVYIVDSPVSYICDTSTGIITRYQGYAIAETQPTTAPVGSTSAILTNNVSSCVFTYAPGTTQRNGVLLMNLTVKKPTSTETVTLINEVSVSNSP